MKEWRRRFLGALLFVSVLVLVYTVIYQWAMFAFEGQERSFFASLQVVIESLTTAGFGGDTDAWNTPQMHVLVIIFNLTGVVLVFLALPLFLFPMLRQALDRPLPTRSDLSNHVIICGHSRRDEVLTAELADANIPYLYIEENRDIVRMLQEQGTPAIAGDAEQVETFEAANIEAARAVVADINDATNPTVILSADRANPAIPIYSVIHQSEAAQYHRLAGADEVIEAPRVLGESLGTRAVTSFAEKFQHTLDVDTPLDVTEILVEEGSELIGETIRDSEALREMDITIFGGWFGGKFIISPDPDTIIQENSILLVSGQIDAFADVQTRALPTHEDDPPRVIICGHGVVGNVVEETVGNYTIEATVLDAVDGPGVDIVGDVTEVATLEAAEINRARAVVLALDEDATTIFATLIINDIAPDVEIIARVHQEDNVWKLYNAGADFALSMSTITGEMLASLLIHDREIIIPQSSFEFVRTKAPAIAGQTMAEADIRANTGCTVVAVERDGELIDQIGPTFELAAGDVLIAAGSAEDLDQLVMFVH